jgi:hypothetical protein
MYVGGASQWYPPSYQALRLAGFVAHCILEVHGMGDLCIAAGNVQRGRFKLQALPIEDNPASSRLEHECWPCRGREVPDEGRLPRSAKQYQYLWCRSHQLPSGGGTRQVVRWEMTLLQAASAPYDRQRNT